MKHQGKNQKNQHKGEKTLFELNFNFGTSEANLSLTRDSKSHLYGISKIRTLNSRKKGQKDNRFMIKSIPSNLKSENRYADIIPNSSTVILNLSRKFKNGDFKSKRSKSTVVRRTSKTPEIFLNNKRFKENLGTGSQKLRKCVLKDEINTIEELSKTLFDPYKKILTRETKEEGEGLSQRFQEIFERKDQNHDNYGIGNYDENNDLKEKLIDGSNCSFFVKRKRGKLCRNDRKYVSFKLKKSSVL